ncbi:MAG: peptide ABC transporter substrate-binding protein [Anaerolineae bacterium]
MLKGIRWQFTALVLAVILLGAAIALQPAPEPAIQSTQPPPTATLPATPTVALQPLAPRDISAPVTLREGVVGQPHRLSPFFTTLNPVDRDIASLIFEGLVGTNAYGEYIPRLAEEWVISDDGLEYVFRLRQDVLWQDGVPFTAADVVTTFNLLQAPGDALPESLTEFWRTVEIELLDEYTVRFRLAQPLAAFLDYARMGIVPAHVFANISAEQLATHPFNLSPIGTGPYQLERITGDETGISSVSLRVAPVYRQRPEGQGGYQIERLVFRMYETEDAAFEALRNGEIDALGGVHRPDLNQIEQTGLVQTHIALEPTIGVVLFNWESENTLAFRDQRARLGLILGTDREGVVNRHLAGSGVLADSPIVPGSWAYDGPILWPAYDPQEAMQLLSEVNFAPPAPQATATPETEPTAEATPEPDITPTPTEPPPAFDFTLLVDDDPARAALAADLVAQWQQLGLRVQLETVTLPVLQERLEAGAFDTALAELTLSPRVDPDPYVFWHQGQYPDGQNYAGINDRRSSELLELARRDPNGIHRAEYYAEFQRVFVNRGLALLLYYPAYQYAVTAKLEGVELGYLSTPADRFYSLRQWMMPGT